MRRNATEVDKYYNINDTDTQRVHETIIVWKKHGERNDNTELAVTVQGHRTTTPRLKIIVTVLTHTAPHIITV